MSRLPDLLRTDGRKASDSQTERGHRRRGRRHDATRRQRYAAVLAFAVGQHGVISLTQLISLGLQPSTVREWVSAGRLHRLYRGVYAVGKRDLPPEGHWMAAVLACGEGALLSHISCAAHRELRPSASSYVHVTVRRRSGLKHRGIKAHRVPTLIGEDVDEVEGIPCTSVARTLLDLAAMRNLDDRGVERAVEQAEIKGQYDHRAVERLLARVAGQPGSRRLARVCGIARPGETVTASALEEKLLALCRHWGLPEPEVNAHIMLAGEPAKVDFLWRKQRVVVEIDAFAYHKTRAAFRRDRRRDRLLELEGYGHARFADQDFDDDLDGIQSTLRRLLVP